MDTAREKIIKLLREESPLTPKQIQNKLKISYSTVRSELTIMKRQGLVQYYHGPISSVDSSKRAFYELTDEGKKGMKET